MPDTAASSSVAKTLGFIRPYRWRLLGLMLLTVVLSLLAMMPPLVMRAVLDKVLTEGNRQLFFGLGLCMILLPVLTALCRYLQTIGIAYVGQRFVFDVRVKLYEHFLNLSLRFFNKHSVGKLVNRLMGDSGIVQQMLTAQSINVVSDLVCAAFATTVTFLINWRLATLLFLVITIFVMNYRINIRRIRRATKGSRVAADRMSGGVQNRLVGNLAVKTFGTESREHEVFRIHSDATLGLGREAMIASNTFSMNTNLIQGLGRSLIYFLGCAMVLKGDLTYGDVVAFTAYAMQLLGPAVRFSELVRQLQNVAIATDRLYEIFDEVPEVVSRPEAKPVTDLKGKVDFNHVTFYYEEGKPVLQDFDLHAEPGQTIALIGPTGCGKSTVLSLLLRFYDVCDGALLIDDVDVRDLELHSYRQHFGIVLQEPLLFNTTIADNIRYGRPSATREEIEQAAIVAEIHEFIMTLPDGYDTVIGDYGVEFSVGQKQRITIARAVAADPRILIMDEATSALDSDSEQAIQRAMDRMLEGRSCFVVAHRLSTIRNADNIVLLDGGTIAEQGNHDQLMAMPNGRYRDLFTKHMGGGVLKEEDIAALSG